MRKALIAFALFVLAIFVYMIMPGEQSMKLFSAAVAVVVVLLILWWTFRDRGGNNLSISPR